jgi:hypothetical protein
MPPGNFEAMSHYEETIKKKVEQDRILKFLDFNLKSKIKNIFGNKKIAVWGSRNSSANRSHFEKMREGDEVLIVEGNKIKLLGIVAAKTINPDLSRELWKNLQGNTNLGWDLVYFIANPYEIDLPFNEFKKLFNYLPNWQLRGFTSVSEEKLTEFYSKYDDLYSILYKIKNGEQPVQVKEEKVKYVPTLEEIDQILTEQELSEHIRMQWTLLRLGLKAGTKVWIPKNDQARIKREYEYNEFEEQFTSGIDVSAKYVENIDVIWKEEFRIDAAFEIENSTAIYSGLLRFSDLKIVAPNSTYPLFIVAPTNKKNRVFEQVKRPTFKQIEFEKKVKYLSYEAVDEIDKFFGSASHGLNINVIAGKAESII